MVGTELCSSSSLFESPFVELCSILVGVFRADAAALAAAAAANKADFGDFIRVSGLFVLLLLKDSLENVHRPHYILYLMFGESAWPFLLSRLFWILF